MAERCGDGRRTDRSSSGRGAAQRLVGDPARTYVEARAAAMSGDHARSATLLTALAAAQPDQVDIVRKALGEALGAGQIELALRLARSIPPQKLTSDVRLLLVADEVKRGRLDRAQQWLKVAGDNGDLTFLAPLLTAWGAADRGDLNTALETIDQVPANSLFGPLRVEQRAFILLKFRRTADADPFARRAIGTAGAREDRLRLAFADGFLAAGDRARALAMLDGMGIGMPIARQRVLAGKLSGQGIDTVAKAYSEALVAFSGDLARMQRGSPPVGLYQVARYVDPQNSSAAVLLGLLLDAQGRSGKH